MKSLVFAMTTVGLLTCGACFAQSTQGADSGKTTPTVANTAASATSSVSGAARQANDAMSINGNKAVVMSSANAPAPMKGSNSFTMSQVKSRLEGNGFSNVSNLSKDNDGIWRGQAQKGGNMTTVWLDYKGNIGEGR